MDYKKALPLTFLLTDLVHVEILHFKSIARRGNTDKGEVLCVCDKEPIGHVHMYAKYSYFI